MRFRQTIWLLPLLVLSSVFLMTAAIPNVPTGTWQTWNPMGDARSGAASVLLRDGRVLIIGGNNATGPVASADVFGTDEVFSAAAVMHTPRSGHTATVLSDGRVLVAGGTTSGGGITNSAEIYDPSANSWNLLSGTMLDARSGHTASLLPDARVLLAGGQNSGGAINSLELFDPSSGNFSGAGVMTSARMKHAAASLQDGRVLLVGGFDGTNPLASSDIFDPAAGVSSAGPSLAVARYSHSATALINGQVAVIGGAGSDGNGGITDFASIEIFDPTAGTFSPANASLTSARQGHQAFLLPNNNDVLIVGGTTTVTSSTSSTEQAIPSSELFAPQVSGTSGAWTYATSTTGTMNTARVGVAGSANQANGPTSAVTSKPGLVIVGGGTDANGNVLASTEAYGYATVQTDQSDYPPGTLVNILGSGFTPGETVTITLVESPLVDTHGPYSVVADGNGNISDSSFTTDSHDVNVRFWLSAVGSQSGYTVQNTFTDSKPNTVSVGTQSPNPVAPAGSVQYTVTVGFNGNGGACASPLSVTSALPVGATSSLNPTFVTNTSPTSTLTITTTNATPPGSSTFTVQAANGTGCQSGSAVTNTGNLVVVENTTTTLSSSVNPTEFGQSTTLTATVSQGTGPTTPNAGTVTFNDGSATLGSGNLSPSGVATLPVSTLTIGAHNLTAFYAGTTNFGASTSNTVPQTVNQAGTTTTVALTSGTSPSVFGQSLTFTATVAAIAPGAGTPTGTVTFKDGVSTLATVGLTGNTAALPTTTLPVGGHSITAVYNTDTNFTGSTSSGLSQTVNQAITNTAITVHTPSPSVAGQPVTINFTVAPVAPGSGTPTGMVTVSDGAGDTCSATVATANCSITFNIAGTKSLTASYPGDTNFTASASSPATSHTVNAASTTTTITGHTPNPSVIGQPLTVNFTVGVNSPGSGTIPGTDNVTVSDGTGDNCTGTVAAGTCQLTPTTFGAKTLTATFAGDANFATSVSAGAAHTVNKRATTTSVSLSPTSVVVGQSSSATVTVTDTDAGTETNPTGTVTLSSSDAGDTFGTCTLAPSGANGATCMASVTPSKVGTSPHTIAATFPADSTHATSNGNASLTVNKANTTTAIISNTPNPSTVGQTVTINYSVSLNSPGAGTPTGNVTVSDGLGDTCTATVGTGNCQIAFNAAGTKTLTATYIGDSNFNTSASSGTSQTVNPKLVISSAAFAILTGTCSSQVTVQTQNNDGTGANGARTLNLSSSSGGGTFYSDAACSSPTSTTSVAASASTATFFYKDAVIGSPVITVAATGLTSTAQTEAVTGLRFSNAAFSVQINSCSSAITLQSANTPGGQPTSLTQATTISLSSSSAGGKFYSDAACTAQITITTISPIIDAGHDSPNFYYEDASAGGPTLTASAGSASAQQTESVVMPPSISKAFGAAAIPMNGNTSLALTITNPAANTVALNGVAFTDTLPTGLAVSTPNGLSNTCGGTTTAIAGSGSISLSGGTVAVSGSCKVIVNVTGTSSGVKNNTTGAVTSTNGGIGNTASATVTVASPPTISKAFGAPSIPLNASTSLTITISNPNTIGLTSLAFTDNLPTGLVVATPSGLSSTCGTATAVAGSGSVSLSAGTVASSSSCSISVNVTATTTGVKNNTTGVISATESGPGAASNTASLTVNTRATSTTISPLTGTVAIGQSATFTVTVADTDSGPVSTPTGVVTVSSTSVADGISSCTLGQTVVGTATCTVTVTPAAPTGTHNISASFTANESVHANSSTATSAALAVTNPATSTAAMSSKNPSVFGDVVTFTAVVTSPAGTPTGSVTFYEGACGGTLLAGPVALDVNGQAGFGKSDFNAGSHTVFACYTPTGVYLASSGSIIQQVNQAQATLGFGTLTFVYDGNPKPVTVMTNPANLTGVTILYAGSPAPPTNAGSTPVAASMSNANYVATPISDTEVIQQAPVMITVTDPHVTYDSNPHQAVIGVSPNVAVVVTYNGSPTAPTSAGVYPVAVTVTDPNYTGTGSGTLTINKATPTVNWANPADISYGTALSATQLSASATFGLSGPPVLGAFTYNPASGTVLPAGDGQTLSTDFAPTDSTDFNSVLGTTVLINVKRDPLYVISTDNSRAFGASDSPLTPTLVGLVAGDTAATVGNPMCNAAVTSASLPGTYAIICSGVTSSNYTVQYINGTLTVTNPLTAITAVTDTRGGTIQIGQTDQLTATGQFADGNKRTLASAGGLPFSRADLATPVSGAALAEAGGVLYAIGGFDGSNTLGTIQAFNPKTNTWSTLSAALSAPRTNAAVASIAGRIYVIGGNDVNSNPLASIEVLDTTVATPAVSAFASSLTTARSNAAAAAWNQKLYVIAGTDAASNPLSSVEIFDLVTGNVSSSDTGAPLAQASAVVVTCNSTSTLYVVGTTSSNVVALSTTDGATWTGPTGASLAAANGVGAVAFNNLLYIVNGANVWSYDGTNFVQKNSLGNPHNASQPAAIGSRIYVASAGSGSPSAKLDAFAPDEVTWASADTTKATIDNSGNVQAVAITSPTVTLAATSISNQSITGAFALTVIKKSQTIQFGTLANATYGDPDIVISATSVDASTNPTNLLVSFAASPANVCTVGAATLSGSTSMVTVHITGAGTCTITASQPGDSTTWAPAPDALQSFSIAKATPTVVVSFATSPITYDGNPHPATTVVTGVNSTVLSGTDGVVTISYTPGGGSAPVNAGTYSASASFASSNPNYNDANSIVGASLTINKATAMVVVTPYTVTYDGNSHTATVTSITGVNGETGATVGTVSLNTTHTNAGTYTTDSWSFTGAANYYNIASTTITDTINKATAMVVVTPYTVPYDGNPHTATVTSITGVNGETGATVGTVSLNTTHTNAGTYTTDSWSFTGAANYYNIASTTITDTINKATAMVAVTPYTVTYDGNPHTATVTSITGVNGETGATVGTVSLNTTHINAGTYTTDSWSFTGAANYNNIASTTILDVINRAPASVTPNAASEVYGTADPLLTGVLSGFVAADNVTATYTRTAGQTVASSPYTISATLSPSSALGNYNITYNTAIFTITAAPLTITASSGSMIYGGPAFPVTPVYGGLVNGDTFASLTTQPACATTATSSSPVSGNPYVSSCSGAADSNYTITYISGLVAVQQASTMTAVVSSSPNNTSTYMQLVTFTATITPQYGGTFPTGTVTFYNNEVQIGTGTLSVASCGLPPCPDQATFSTSSLPDSGPDSITVVYGGDGNFVTNTSPAIIQTVQPAPNVSLAPLSVSFGNQNVNTTSKPATVILTNIGDANLNISANGISIIPNTDFSQTNNCGSSVAAGKSCTINITFTPIDTGIRAASLQITDNDDDAISAQQIVSLTGSGLSTIMGGSLYTDAIFATANGCGSIVMSGGSTVDSFNSTQGYSSSHQLAGGNVGSNGNVTLSGSKSAIYGSAAVDSLATGNCSKTAVTGATTNGGAQLTGGIIPLTNPITYPAPPAPSPAPPTTSQNISGSCGSISGCTNTGTKMVSLAPGQYGNLNISGGTTAHFTRGTYNINSLTLSGQSIFYVDSGPVVVNLAGASLSGGNPAMDASGGSIQNPSGIPANLQFTYAGSRGLNLTGGSASYATVDAPNALVNMTGGSDFFGSIIASTVTNSGGTAIHYDTNLPAINGGNYIWFDAVVNNVTGIPSSGQVKLYLTNSSVSFTENGAPYSMAVPNAVVTFNSSTGLGTTYSTTSSRWNTSVPKSSLTGNTFVAGVAFPVPSNFPTGIQNVAWSASFSTDTPGITLQWQWGAAVYTSLNTCYAYQNTDSSNACYNIVSNSNVLGVNAEDGAADANGTDPAGTPETYKASVSFGATGGGGTNYTGYFTPGAGVVPTVAPMSVSPSSLGFAAQMQGSTSASMTTVLTNNDSASHMISSIATAGTNAGDFAATNNCPLFPNAMTAGTSCTVTVTFTPSDVGTRTAKIVVDDDANNSPQTVYLSGTGQ